MDTGVFCMSRFSEESPSSYSKEAQSSFSRLWRRTRPRKRASRGSLFWLAFLPLILLSGVLSNWIFLAQTAYAAPNTAYSAPGHLTAQQALSEGQALTQNKGKFKRPTSEPASNKLDKNASKNKPLPSSEPAAMHDGVFTLDDSFVLH